MKKLTKIGLVLLGVGVVSLAMQVMYNLRYGDVDTQGFVNDTILIPIGTFSLVGAVVMLAISGIRFLMRKQDKKS